MMKNPKTLGIVAGIIFLLYFISLPYLTVYQMKAAAEEHDGEALSEHVDFRSVRKSLKDQMNVMFAKEMSKQSEENPFAALGAAFGGIIVEKMVDAYITPAGLTQMMRGENPDSETSVEPSENESSGNKEPFKNASQSYNSFNKFSITVKGDDSDEETKCILGRDGLTWKRTEILLPL